MLLSILIISSIIEELLFRKLLFDFFKEKLKSRKKSIIFVSFLFFIAHKFYLKILFLTIVLAFVRYKKNSIFLCIFIHLTYNIILYILFS
ncbi:CPBP family glutamic-type intramembrane protease [Fusobacterium sp.]|uniref:CPBP family glutamic-type intramembrane protease n=1 Tax=Fusobacterium sp. TaxID=68766 RepID=UPI00345B0693